MKVCVDLNVILDYLLDRTPFAEAAEKIFENGENSYFVSAHMVTTALYLVHPHGIEAQNAALDFILENFTVVSCDKALLVAARTLEFADYEDAVVAAAAGKAKCACIVTRNPRDFANSPVPALTPAEFLAL